MQHITHIIISLSYILSSKQLCYCLQANYDMPISSRHNIIFLFFFIFMCCSLLSFLKSDNSDLTFHDEKLWDQILSIHMQNDAINVSPFYCKHQYSRIVVSIFDQIGLCCSCGSGLCVCGTWPTHIRAGHGYQKLTLNWHYFSNSKLHAMFTPHQVFLFSFECKIRYLRSLISTTHYRNISLLQRTPIYIIGAQT